MTIALPSLGADLGLSRATLTWVVTAYTLMFGGLMLFHGTERNRALGVWGALGGTGAAAGVLLGGLITAGPGWEWIFYIDVPIGLAILVALPSVVRRHRTDRAPHRIDLPGVGASPPLAALAVRRSYFRRS